MDIRYNGTSPISCGCRNDNKKEYTKEILRNTNEIQKELAVLYTIIHPQDNLTDFKNISLTNYHIRKIKEISNYVEGVIWKLERELIEGGKNV